MKFRFNIIFKYKNEFILKEGNGTAYYKIGLMDNGYPIGISKSDMFFSLRTVCLMASTLKANIIL